MWKCCCCFSYADARARSPTHQHSLINTSTHQQSLRQRDCSNATECRHHRFQGDQLHPTPYILHKAKWYQWMAAEGRWNGGGDDNRAYTVPLLRLRTRAEIAERQHWKIFCLANTPTVHPPRRLRAHDAPTGLIRHHRTISQPGQEEACRIPHTGCLVPRRTYTLDVSCAPERAGYSIDVETVCTP